MTIYHYVSRILRGNLNLRKDSLNLESVVKSALTTVNLLAEAKSIQITTEFEPNILQVAGDAGRLQQVVWNLVSNAIKFTPEGVRVEIKLSSVTSHSSLAEESTTADQGQMTQRCDPALTREWESAPRQNEFAQIQVTDTGQGIDEKFLPYAFERFRQAESISTRRFGGLCLGFAIVRHLTELHGGTVAASSPGLDKELLLALGYH